MWGADATGTGAIAKVTGVDDVTTKAGAGAKIVRAVTT